MADQGPGFASFPMSALNLPYQCDEARQACRFALPGSPSQAPLEIDLSGTPLEEQAQAMALNTAGDGKERGARFVLGKGEVLRIDGYVTDDDAHGVYIYPSPGKVGSIHTHPRPSPPGGGDIAKAVNAGESITLVESASVRYLLVRTHETPSDVDHRELQRRREVETTNAARAARMAEAEAEEFSSLVMAAEQGFAFYKAEGKDNFVFRRVDLDMSGLPRDSGTGFLDEVSLHELVRRTQQSRSQAGYRGLSPLLSGHSALASLPTPTSDHPWRLAPSASLVGTSTFAESSLDLAVSPAFGLDTTARLVASGDHLAAAGVGWKDNLFNVRLAYQGRLGATGWGDASLFAQVNLDVPLKAAKSATTQAAGLVGASLDKVGPRWILGADLALQASTVAGNSLGLNAMPLRIGLRGDDQNFGFTLGLVAQANVSPGQAVRASMGVALSAKSDFIIPLALSAQLNFFGQTSAIGGGGTAYSSAGPSLSLQVGIAPVF